MVQSNTPKNAAGENKGSQPEKNGEDEQPLATKERKDCAHCKHNVEELRGNLDYPCLKATELDHLSLPRACPGSRCDITLKDQGKNSRRNHSALCRLCYPTSGSLSRSLPQSCCFHSELIERVYNGDSRVLSPKHEAKASNEYSGGAHRSAYGNLHNDGLATCADQTHSTSAEHSSMPFYYVNNRSQFCMGCGKLRSKSFHRRNPVNLGCHPVPSMCRKCSKRQFFDGSCFDRHPRRGRYTSRDSVEREVIHVQFVDGERSRHVHSSPRSHTRIHLREEKASPSGRAYQSRPGREEIIHRRTVVRSPASLDRSRSVDSAGVYRSARGYTRGRRDSLSNADVDTVKEIARDEAREVFAGYKNAERRLDAHPRAYSHGRFVPVGSPLRTQQAAGTPSERVTTIRREYYPSHPEVRQRSLGRSLSRSPGLRSALRSPNRPANVRTTSDTYVTTESYPAVSSPRPRVQFAPEPTTSRRRNSVSDPCVTTIPSRTRRRYQYGVDGHYSGWDDYSPPSKHKVNLLIQLSPSSPKTQHRKINVSPLTRPGYYSPPHYDYPDADVHTLESDSSPPNIYYSRSSPTRYLVVEQGRRPYADAYDSPTPRRSPRAAPTRRRDVEIRASEERDARGRPRRYVEVHEVDSGSEDGRGRAREREREYELGRHGYEHGRGGWEEERRYGVREV